MRLAESDLVMAGMALEHSFFEQCVFHCHQAIEKLLKAIWTEREDMGAAPKTHNLAGLAIELFPGMPEEDMSLLRRLAQQYLPSRYVEYETAYSGVDTLTYYRR